MFYILWQFDVDDARAAAFAEAYGPAGSWEALFRQGEGFRGTEVFRRTAAPARFLTLDCWVSRDAYEAFRRERATDYAVLDAACEALTTSETFLAAWEA
ncbi:MAG TPA: antibiotic biosynthesis monooxygenase [Gemmatimonadales bacterium]